MLALAVSFAVLAPPGITTADYIIGPMQAKVQEHLASGSFPNLKGMDLRIRISLAEASPISDETREGNGSGSVAVSRSWDILVVDGKTATIKSAEQSVTANAEIVMSEADFRRSQVGDLPQLEFLRLMQGDREKFALLRRLTGETALSLASDHGAPIDVLFRFNGGGGRTTYVTMSYDNMRGILAGKKNMSWLYVTQRIRHKGSFALLQDSGNILDPG